jgi:hypothetical protein
MSPMRLSVALLVAQMFAGAVLAQEFTSVSGGEVELLTKGPKKLSGSLGVTRSNQALNGYEATLGGTILEDRIWFFAAASILPEVSLSSNVGAVDAKLNAQLGSRNTLGASYSEFNQPLVASPAVLTIVPSSFLSLRYTSVISDNIFFNASFLRSSSKGNDVVNPR